MTTFLLICGALALSLSLVWLFSRPVAGMVAAYFGSWAMMKSGYAIIGQNELLFWAVAVIIVAGIQVARGSKVMVPRALRAYIAGGALTLTAVGAVMGHGWMIAGAVAGVALGALAFSRINRQAVGGLGRVVVAVGAPVVVAVILIALSVSGLLLRTDLV